MKKLNRKLVLAEKDTPVVEEVVVEPLVEPITVAEVAVEEPAIALKPRKPRTKKIVEEETATEKETKTKPKATTKKMKLVLQE